MFFGGVCFMIEVCRRESMVHWAHVNLKVRTSLLLNLFVTEEGCRLSLSLSNLMWWLDRWIGRLGPNRLQLLQADTHVHTAYATCTTEERKQSDAQTQTMQSSGPLLWAAAHSLVCFALVWCDRRWGSSCLVNQPSLPHHPNPTQPLVYHIGFTSCQAWLGLASLNYHTTATRMRATT